MSYKGPGEENEDPESDFEETSEVEATEERTITIIVPTAPQYEYIGGLNGDEAE